MLSTICRLVLGAAGALVAITVAPVTIMAIANVFNLLIIQCLSVNRFYSFGSPPRLPRHLHYWKNDRNGAKLFIHFACLPAITRHSPPSFIVQKIKYVKQSKPLCCQKYTKSGSKSPQPLYFGALV